VADSARGGAVEFYASGAGDRVLPGRRVAVDRRPYHPRAPAQRDWGHRWLSQVWAGAGPDVGLFLGGGALLTTYGFRKDPFASRYRLRAGYATGAATARAEFAAEWRWPNSGVQSNLLARASGIEVLRFNGFGNETKLSGPTSFYRVNQVEYLLEPSLTVPLAPRLSLSFGPSLEYSSTDLEQDRFISLARPYGSGEFGTVGARAGLRLDTRDTPAAATRGVLLSATGSFHPGVWDVEEAFGEVHGEAATYLSATQIALRPILALRVGGKRVWGRYPFQEAAYIGGSTTVRLGRENRFGGDASLFANAELRLFLSRVTIVLPGDFGIFGLGDIGRVYYRGESSDVWHGAVGGGAWLSFLSPANTVSIAVAKSEERTGVYVRAGFGF
jgi:hypothetical protein